MTEVSQPVPERARKIASLILQALAAPGTQVSVASAMGASESTISWIKNDHLDTFSQMLAHLGLKVVPQTHVCVDRESYEAMTLIASRAMADRDIAKKLIWEGE